MSVALILALATGSLGSGPPPVQEGVDLPELGLSVQLPAGWQGRWVQHAGQRLYQVTLAASPGAGGLRVGASMAPPDLSGQSVETSLKTLATQLELSIDGAALRSNVKLSWDPWETKTFTVGGHPGGILWMKARKFAGRGTAIHAFIGIVKRGAWTYSLSGHWTVAANEAFSAGAPKLLRSFRVRVPEGPVKALRGCWTLGEDSQLVLDEEGVYVLRHDGAEEQGSWRAHGKSFGFFPAEAPSRRDDFVHEGDRLTIGEQAYARCK